MPVPNISEFNNYASLDHTNAYMQKCMSVGQFDEEPPCPWVKVGRLYLSVTFTGDSSWKPMLLDLYKEGKRSFTVMTGRHGRQAGGFGLDGQMVVGDLAAHHYKEDLTVAGQLTGANAGLKIDVVDVGTGKYTKKDALAHRARQDLQKGNIVFFAWCYSLYSMLLFDPANETTQVVLGVVNQTVRNIVQDSFNWAPR